MREFLSAEKERGFRSPPNVELRDVSAAHLVHAEATRLDPIVLNASLEVS